MKVTLEDGRAVKEASTGRERERLRGEAAVLTAAAHPGVVRLIDASADSLVLERVAGPCLIAIAIDEQPLTVVAGWGAALATTVADLHDIGYVHGAIEADHVLFDGSGRPVLCGFGRARQIRAATTADGAEAADVAALARLLSSRLPAGAPAKLRRALARAAESREVGGIFARRLDARAVAALLVKEVPEARLSAEVPPRDTPSSLAVARPRHRKALFGAAVCALCVVACIAATMIPTSHQSAHAQYRPARTLRSGGRIYRLSIGSGERAKMVTGRWSCGSVAPPAVLDTASGEVWVFDGWPARGKVAGRLVERVPGATGLETEPASTGCDDLAVLRGRGQPVILKPGQG